MAETLSTPAASRLASLPGDHPAQAYATLPARELVRLVQYAGDHPHHPETQVIFTAFYHRYGPYLVSVVARQLGPLHDRSGLQEVVHDAFLDFFAKSRRFDPDLTTDDTVCDQNLRSYLAKLANWKAGDARSFQQSIGAHATEHETLDARLNSPHQSGAPETARIEPAAMQTERARRVAEWIGTLPPREEDILRTYVLDDNPGQKSGRLPEGVARALAKKYGVTTSNIRHLKLKLFREFRQQFASDSP
jgi:RNA polymerase sigma factor (sigma-70 family)